MAKNVHKVLQAIYGKCNFFIFATPLELHCKEQVSRATTAKIICEQNKFAGKIERKKKLKRITERQI